MFLAWHGAYTNYEHELDMKLRAGSPKPITDQGELGVAPHKKDKPIKIWWYSFDRLGLAYSFSSSGELKGVSMVFRSVFDR